MCEKNENNMYVKPQYKCAVCGKIYDSIAERTNCERSCLKKQEAEAKVAAEKRKKEERDARQQEVTAALDNAFTLVNKFVEDYGSYKYNGKLDALDAANMDFFPSKLWHHFWF